MTTTKARIRLEVLCGSIQSDAREISLLAATMELPDNDLYALEQFAEALQSAFAKIPSHLYRYAENLHTE